MHVTFREVPREYMVMARQTDCLVSEVNGIIYTSTLVNVTGGKVLVCPALPGKSDLVIEQNLLK